MSPCDIALYTTLIEHTYYIILALKQYKYCLRFLKDAQQEALEENRLS